MILLNGKEWEPEQTDYIAWERTYKNIDVYAEVMAAECWIDANPTKRKKNGKAFLVNWLKRADLQGGSPMTQPKYRTEAKSTRNMSMEEMMSRDWAQ